MNIECRFRKSLPMASACGVDSLVGKSYKNLGALFFEEQQPDSAIHYLEKARLFLSPSHNAKDLSHVFGDVHDGIRPEFRQPGNYRSGQSRWIR